MELLLIIMLGISILAYSIRVYMWLKCSYLWIWKPKSEVIKNLKITYGQKKWWFITSGIEHLIIFLSLVISFIIFI